jgi:hypothetical protein
MSLETEIQTLTVAIRDLITALNGTKPEASAPAPEAKAPEVKAPKAKAPAPEVKAPTPEAKPEEVKTPAPEAKAPTPETKAVSLAQVQAVASKLVIAAKQAHVVTELTKLKAKKLSEVAPADYETLLNALNKYL